MGKSVQTIYTCDVCGAALEAEAAYSFAINYAMPGKGVKAISCPDEQHYGCSPEHAAQAAKQCIDHLELERQALTV